MHPRHNLPPLLVLHQIYLLPRSRFSAYRLSTPPSLLLPRSFYLSRFCLRMSGDDRRRPRRWNEAKPFRATAPAWLPAFQAPANLLRHKCTVAAHTYAHERKVLDERTRKRRGIQVGIAKARGKRMRTKRIGFIIHFLARRDLSLSRTLSSALVSNHNPYQ